VVLLAILGCLFQLSVLGAWSDGYDLAGWASGDAGKVEITYIVTGDHPVVDLSIDTPGGSEYHDAPLPFKATYKFEPHDVVQVAATMPFESGRGNVMCMIVADGKVVQRSSASDERAHVNCTSIVGVDKPLPGVTIPH